MKQCDFSILIGKTLTRIDVRDDYITFYTDDNKRFCMFHEEDCCESVSIDEIIGVDIQELIGDPILLAEERSNRDDPPKSVYDNESYTWTFYELATIKGAVTIRWYGSSNGYYSEAVSFCEA